MAKRTIIQKRGKGGPSYASPSHRFFGKLAYPEVKEQTYGEVVDIVNSIGHSAPLMIVELDNQQMCLIPAPFSIRVGQRISFGSKDVQIGNVIRLKDAVPGTIVCNIESNPGDRGKFLRACGASAQVVTVGSKKVTIKLPSKSKKELNANCLATVGVVAGSGRKARPMIKAGNKFHARKARNKLFPIVKGVAMNACNHPHGGTHRRNLGRPTAIKRGAPAGRKSGSIGARRMGRKKK
ncbi:50S ribosomal protein L2 [Candidatus Woesearchaeota archaeon]|jgi:large subunit ribosomal protein L2|nr:50S ribosomal protein L2 [Candidatus Woesearchaeota archaeon]MBT7402797.1 50S ribosomal protein L2 [Candidatus Woesearchaeota archaeon]